MAGTTEKQVIFVIGMRDELSKGVKSAKNSIDRLSEAFTGVGDGSRKSLQKAAERLKFLNKEGRQYEAAQLRAQVSTVNFGKITDAVTQGNMKGFTGAKNILKSFTGGLGKTQGAAGKFLYATQAIGPAWSKAAVAFKAIPWIGWILAIVDAVKMFAGILQNVMKISEEINKRMIELNKKVATYGQQWVTVRQRFNDWAIDFAATQKEIAEIQATWNIRQVRLITGTQQQQQAAEQFAKAQHRLALTTEFTAQTAQEALQQFQLWYNTEAGFEVLGAQLHAIVKNTKLTANEASDAIRSFSRLSIYMGKRLDPKPLLAVAAAIRQMEGNVTETADSLVELGRGWSVQSLVQREFIANAAGVNSQLAQTIWQSGDAARMEDLRVQALMRLGKEQVRNLALSGQLQQLLGVSEEQAARYFKQYGEGAEGLAKFRKQMAANQRQMQQQQAMQQQMQAFRDMGGELSRLWDVIKGAFIPIIGELGDTLRPIIKLVVGILIPILKVLAKSLLFVARVVRIMAIPFELIIAGFQALGGLLGIVDDGMSAAASTMEKATGAANMFWKIIDLVLHPIDLMATLLDAAFGSHLVDDLKNLTGGMKIFKDVLNWVLNPIGLLLDGIKWLGQNIINYLFGSPCIFLTVADALGVFGDVMGVVMSPIMALINAFGSLSSAAGAAWNKLMEWGGGALDGISGAISSVGTALSDAWGSMTNWAGGVMDTAGEKLTELGKKFEGAYDTVKEGAAKAWEKIKEVPGVDKALEAGKSVLGWLGFKEGGIIKDPTFSLMGEAGPEAVLPLTDKNAFQRVLGEMLEGFPRAAGWLQSAMSGVSSAAAAAPTPVGQGVSVPAGAAPVNVEAPKVNVNVNTSGVEELLQKILSALINGNGASGGATSADANMKPESGGILETFLTNWDI